MSKKTILESAHFDLANGGIGLSIIEREDVRKNCRVLPPDWHDRLKRQDTAAVIDDELAKLPVETRYNRRWRLRVALNHFGSAVRFEMPLVPFMVRWLVEALQRTLAHMEADTGKPTDGLEYAFQNLRHAHVVACGGIAVDEQWCGEPTQWSPVVERSKNDCCTRYRIEGRGVVSLGPATTLTLKLDHADHTTVLGVKSWAAQREEIENLCRRIDRYWTMEGIRQAIQKILGTDGEVVL